MHHNADILAKLDLCRPGSDDLAQPELAEAAELVARDPAARGLYERLQQIDLAIARSMSRASVPDGLLARLLEAVDAAGPGASGAPGPGEGLELHPAPQLRPAEHPAPGQLLPLTQETAERTQRWIRRLAVTAAAACLLAALAALPRSQQFQLEGVLADARSLYSAEEAAAEAPGHVRHMRPLPLGFDASRYVVLSQNPDVRWHRVKGLLGRNGVAFELVGPDGARATLYAVKLGTYSGASSLRKILSTQPPARGLTTENRTTAAWREDNLVFVLVVDGDAAAYERLVRPLGPVA